MYLFLLFCIGTESVDEIRRHLGDTRGFSFVQTCDRLPRIMTGVFHELTDAVLNGISLKYILDGEVIEETFNVVVAFVPLGIQLLQTTAVLLRCVNQTHTQFSLFSLSDGWTSSQQ